MKQFEIAKNKFSRLVTSPATLNIKQQILKSSSTLSE